MLRWIVHKQMDVMVFAVHFNELRLKVETDFGESGSEPVESISVQHPCAVLCYKDQMYVNLKYAMSTVSDFA